MTGSEIEKPSEAQHQAPSDRYMHFPAMVKPRPVHNKLYRVTVGQDGLAVGTLPGLYGHKESVMLVHVPSARILQAKCIAHSQKKTCWCTITFLDGAGKQQILNIAAVGERMWYSDVPDDKQVTEMACMLLEWMRLGHPIRVSKPYHFTLRPVNPVWKLIAVALFLVAFFLLPSLQVRGALSESWFLVYGVMLVALVVFLIDLLRLHTSWHPAIKFGVVALVSLVLGLFFGVLWALLPR